MNITLKPEQEQFIESQIKQGVFTDFTQAIDLALNLLQAQGPNYVKSLEDLALAESGLDDYLTNLEDYEECLARGEIKW